MVGEIVLILLDTKRRRKDQICVARRLVEVEVDGDEVLETVERRLEPAAVWCREGGVRRDRDKRTDLPSSFGLDFLGENAGRQLATELGQPAHPRAVTGERP